MDTRSRAARILAMSRTPDSTSKPERSLLSGPKKSSTCLQNGDNDIFYVCEVQQAEENCLVTVKNAVIEETCDSSNQELENEAHNHSSPCEVSDESVTKDVSSSCEEASDASDEEYFPSDDCDTDAENCGEVSSVQNIRSKEFSLSKKEENENHNVSSTSEEQDTSGNMNIIQKSETGPTVNINEESASGIFIRASAKDDYGKRVRDKIHNCYYCNKLYKDLGKHLQNKHKEEIEVSKLLAMDKKSEERRKTFLRLTRVGDYYHNCEVLKKKCGELILARLPTPEEKRLYKVSDYGPCPDCLGFMLKRHLWHHIRYSCSENKKALPTRRQVISESTSLLTHTFCDISTSSEFTRCIIAALKNDNISLVCRQDSLIMKFGAMQFEKYHNTQNDLIRQSIRQLGRLLIELRKFDQEKIRLSDWLKPISFDNVITAVKNISCVKYSSKNRPQFGTPSLALKLGYSLRKCVAIEKGISLRKEDLKRVESLNSFLSIMDLEWSIKVSSSALNTLHERKMNVAELLPLTEDLIKLNARINKNLIEAKSNLHVEVNYSNWSRLASATLCKMILFNKRRSGEASRITVLQYSSRPNWSDTCASEFKNTLSPFEIELASKLAIVQIKGKRGRTVNILLTADVKEAIDSLLLHRSKFTSSENPYIFARSNPSMEYIRGHECLHKVVIDANLTRPELINATKLRKYIATVCQIFNLSETETDWLARHLGHDIRVHRDFYRLHESSVELAKISRLLLAVENGNATKFAGKKLDEINICDLPDLELDQESIETESKEMGAEDTQLSTVPSQHKRNEYRDREPENKAISNNKKKTIRRPWSSEESAVVLSHFRGYLKNNKSAPGKEDCLQCLSNNTSVLGSRNWKDVKYFVYNYMKKLR